MPLSGTVLFAGALAAAIAATQHQTLKIRIYPIPGYSERGTATIVQRGTDAIVDIDVTGVSRGTPGQYAHLHKGTCEHVSAPTVYVLHPVRDGRSVTRLENVTLTMFARGTYSILIHKSLSHDSVHVACGTIAGT